MIACGMMPNIIVQLKILLSLDVMIFLFLVRMINYVLIYYARKILCCFATVNTINFVHFPSLKMKKKENLDW